MTRERGAESGMLYSRSHNIDEYSRGALAAAERQPVGTTTDCLTSGDVTSLTSDVIATTTWNYHSCAYEHEWHEIMRVHELQSLSLWGGR
jgi:hypothetical protein